MSIGVTGPGTCDEKVFGTLVRNDLSEPNVKRPFEADPGEN
jgi:hypothetical protein